MENTVKITIDPYGREHAAAAEIELANPYRYAFIDRDGIVYVKASSTEAGHWKYPIPDYDGLTEFAREADAALRAAVADQ